MTEGDVHLIMPLHRRRPEGNGEPTESDSYVPIEVLESIEDLEQGNTATKEEIESVLKF